MYPAIGKEEILCVNQKKGNLSECSNCRRITSIFLSGNVVSNIIYARMKDEAQGAIREEQTGYRKYRGYFEHNFALGNIIEQCEE